MAFPWTPPNCHSLLNPSSSSLTPQQQSHLFPSLKPLKFNPCYSHKPQQHLSINTAITSTDDGVVPKKPKRKPRPSFYEQIRDKWSTKPISHTKKLPWQLPNEQQHGKSSQILEENLTKLVEGKNVGGSQSFDLVVKEEEPNFHLGKTQLKDGLFDENGSENVVEFGGNLDGGVVGGEVVSSVEGNVRISRGEGSNVRLSRSKSVDDDFESDKRGISVNKLPWVANQVNGERRKTKNDDGFGSDKRGSSANKLPWVANEVEGERRKASKNDGDFGSEMRGSSGNKLPWVANEANGERRKGSKNDDGFESFLRGSSGNELPWMGDEGDGERRKTRKMDFGENVIPEHELKRLRNVALRMKERLKVGAGGVTQAVVGAIHEKWKVDEVVKLRFEGPSGFNMKRIHDVLESKTGGVVIWRSGTSVVIYRGFTYKLDCVHTYIKEKGFDAEKSEPGPVRLQKDLSKKELMELNQLNDLLDGLGPRYADWSGRPPFPVDADLLPGVVPGYKTPFRLLPHGVPRSLKDHETTNIRRQARIMPPHFALGRNRELQGLAAAMVKLWEKNAIAKIAIKRGVLNTSNERMTEELKRLTGGTLLSRNKEFIVFYRGNDFLPPPVTESLKERERLTMLQYQEEDARRNASTLIKPKLRKSKVPVVAGTLAETAAATSRWAKQHNSDDVDKMVKDAAVARRASLVKYLQKKLVFANGKLKKAEKALLKVQEYLEPEDLPTDLETITDEERLVFRKMGLSMKPHLLIGRREVFDGTIENMHMHWKFRELVKIIVKGKHFGQVKHIAISLEAESGGVVVSIDKTTKGYAIIIYRGKNYRQPIQLKPRNLLTRRQALARSIELQRREGLKHHISDLHEQMELVKSELEDLENAKELDDKTFYKKLDDDLIPSDDDMEEDEDESEDEEAYLQTYDSGDEENVV